MGSHSKTSATVTLYVRPEARPTFDEAKRLAGEESLSTFVEKAVTEYVERLRLDPVGDFQEQRLPTGAGNRRIVFYGKKVWPPDSDDVDATDLSIQAWRYIREYEEANGRYTTTIWVGPKGKLLVHDWDGYQDSAQYVVADTIETLPESVRDDAVLEWIEVALGHFRIRRIDL